MTSEEYRDQEYCRNALRQVGLDVASVYELVNSSQSYAFAIPVLLQCLASVSNEKVKEGIVRALGVPEASAFAEEALLDEFAKLKGDASSFPLKWSIANTLSVIATDRYFDRISALVREPSHGKAREMLAIALARTKDPRAIGVLIDLLADEQIAGHAIKGLGKIRATASLHNLYPFLQHRKAWIRRAAKTAIRLIKKNL